MRHFAFATLLLFGAASCWGPFQTLAHADEKSEQQEDSDAARLFREGWWLETGSGALEKAAESYREAVRAAGSTAIRARAQYRLALVQERMGRTEEAVRALETLATQFSDQTELLARARTKLEAWSGQDLREHFADWYQRYQYSPVFQSKIVDLVLQLGASDHKLSQAASQELLTIGQPTLPALRAHATSANLQLRNAVVGLMIRLKELPPPEALFRTTSRGSTPFFWELVAELQEPARSALAAAARELPGDTRAQSVLAVLAGPSAMIDLIAKNRDKTLRLVSDFWTALRASELSAQDQERLRAIPGDKAVAGFVRGNVANYIAYTHDWKGTKADPIGFMEADLLGWARSDEPSVRAVVWHIMKDTLVRDVDAWQVPAGWLRDASGATAEHYSVVQALLGQLRLVPAGSDVQLAVASLMRTIDEGNAIDHSPAALLSRSKTELTGSAVIPRRVYGQAIGRAKGEQASDMPKKWWKVVGREQSELGQVLEWIGHAADRRVRVAAMHVAARELRGGVGRLLVPLANERLRQELAGALFQSLQYNTTLEALDWDRESLTLLVEAAEVDGAQETRRLSQPAKTVWARSVPIGGVEKTVETRLSQTAAGVFARLLQVEALRDELLAAAAAAPERFTADIWPLLGNDWSRVPANRALSFLKSGWAQWSPEQKPVGLKMFLAQELVGRGDAALNAFLRSVLTDSGASLDTRETAAWALSDLTLRDVTAAFDLDQPEEAEVAVGFLLRGLPRAEETYDAFKKLLGAQTTSDQIVGRIEENFRDEPESRVRDLIERLLAVPDGTTASVRVVNLLNNRERAEDLPLWRIALKHPDSGVRLAAATALGNLYDEASIGALAFVVDDPDPRVRDAALKSLERIETIEKQKAHWRKFAEGK